MEKEKKGLPILVVAMKDLDEDLIDDAMHYKPRKKRRILRIICGLVASFALLIILGVWYKCNTEDTKDDGSEFCEEVSTQEGNVPGEGELAGQEGSVPETSESMNNSEIIFCYEEGVYKYTKEYLYTMPEGARYVGEIVKKEYEDITEYKDLEGNESGRIYIDERDKEVIYFIGESVNNEEGKEEQILIFKKVK